MAEPEPRVEYLPVPGGCLAYRRAGEGPRTVVWVHGLPLDGLSWAAQMAHFRGRARNVFVDLRGYGRSSRLPADVRDVTGLYAEDLDRLFGALGLRDAALVGFASGGHAALRFAAGAPPTLGRLAVINASPAFRRAPGWPWGFDEAGIGHFAGAFEEGGLEGLTDAVLDPDLVFRDLPPAQARPLVARFRKMALKAGGDTLMAFFEKISRDDDRDLLDRITVPTLVVSSTLGLEVPSEVGLYMRRNIPRARLVEVPGADHFVFATRPGLINLLLEQFLVPSNEVAEVE